MAELEEDIKKNLNMDRIFGGGTLRTYFWGGDIVRINYIRDEIYIRVVKNFYQFLRCHYVSYGRSNRNDLICQAYKESTLFTI